MAGPPVSGEKGCYLPSFYSAEAQSLIYPAEHSSQLLTYQPLAPEGCELHPNDCFKFCFYLGYFLRGNFMYDFRHTYWRGHFISPYLLLSHNL